MSKMSKTYRQELRPKLKPRQLKRQKLKELLQWDQPQPDFRPEPLQYKPLG
ncbi:MAG: hypothetical protein JWR68_1268 [Polaromonas sp.]|nr:hypothetical protein [Polaromonas sp.]